MSKTERDIAKWRRENKDSWAKWHDEAMKELEDAGATGVVMDAYDTNIGLAPRDYTRDCAIAHVSEGGPQGCIILYKGYWFWWCKTHYQPLYSCDVGKLENQLKELT